MELQSGVARLNTQRDLSDLATTARVPMNLSVGENVEDVFFLWDTGY